MLQVPDRILQADLVNALIRDACKVRNDAAPSPQRPRPGLSYSHPAEVARPSLRFQARQPGRR